MATNKCGLRIGRAALAAVVWTLASAPLWAASRCSDILELDEDDGASRESCLTALIRDTTRSGYRALDIDSDQAMTRFYIDGGVVVAQCIRARTVTFEAVHPEDGKACDVLNLIRDAITGD